MPAFSYRYNRFSQSYLINYRNYEFEADPELFTIVYIYYQVMNIDSALNNLNEKDITISREDLIELISMIEFQSADHGPLRQRRTYKLIDFSFFNKFLHRKIFGWSLFVIIFVACFSQLHLLEEFFVLPKATEYSFTTILMIVPIYYFSRFIFTPIHEFGHYFFYYLFTNKPASMYIQIPGIMYFGAL